MISWKELKQKSNPELQSLLAEQRNSLRELRFKEVNQQLKTVRQLRQVKKTIAQILTLLNKKSPPSEATARQSVS